MNQKGTHQPGLLRKAGLATDLPPKLLAFV